MFAESNGDRPQQLVGVGCEANAFAEIEQKQRVRFRLLAPGDVSDRDVDAEQLAGARCAPGNNCTASGAFFADAMG